MIITCEQCSTRFQLDDSRVPARGVRVRCSRCKHAFFVKPTASAGDLVAKVVEGALAEEAEAEAGSTQELASGAALSAGSEPEPSPLEPAGEEGLDDGLEESGWEFDDEAAKLGFSPGSEAGPAPDEAGLAAAREAVDDLLGADPEAPSEAGGEAPSGAAADGRVEPDPGVSDDVDSLLGAAPAEPDLEVDAPAGPPEPEAALPRVDEPVEPPSGEQEVPAERELGSPADWDFFDDGAEDSGAEPEAIPRAALGRIEGHRARPPVRPSPVRIDLDSEPSKLPAWLRRVAHGAGWSVVTLLVGVILYRVSVPAGQAPPVERTAQAVAGLEASSVQGRWVENAVAGPIYVISGKLHSARSAGVMPGARLAVRLFDAGGALLAEEAAVLGPALPTVRLREEDPRELRAIQASKALSMARTPIGPYQGLAFHAILDSVPPQARRFDLAAFAVEEPPPASEDLGLPETGEGEGEEGLGEPLSEPAALPFPPGAQPPGLGPERGSTRPRPETG